MGLRTQRSGDEEDSRYPQEEPSTRGATGGLKVPKDGSGVPST
jgi:hypothetical protein